MASTTILDQFTINYLSEQQYQDAVDAGIIDPNALYLTPHSGGGGVSSYNDLTDKPSIEGVTLSGNKTFPQLNLDVLSNSDIEDIFQDLI